MEHVRKQGSLKKKEGGFSPWTRSAQSYPKTAMGSCNRNSTAMEDMGGRSSMSSGTRITPAWHLVAVMMRERWMISFLIYAFGHSDQF